MDRPPLASAIRRAVVLALAATLALGCAGASRLPAGKAGGKRAATAGEPSAGNARRLALTTGGALELAIPPSWIVTEGEEEGSAPPTFEIASPDRAFVMFVTPMWNPNDPSAAADPEAARSLTELARRKAAASAAEKEIALEELTGEGVKGYWFHATDQKLVGKPVPEGEFRNLMQGALAVGRFVVAFTLLDDAPGPHRETVLDMLRRARDLPPSGGAVALEALEPDPSVQTVPLEIQPPGKGWSVLVDLPGFEAMTTRSSPSGGGVQALAKNDSGLVVSVILRQAEGAQDARACRDRFLERLRSLVEGVTDVVVADRGGVARARYLVPRMDGKEVRQGNAHAWLIREGYCVDVHVSKMAFEKGDAEALERILGSVRFGETL